MLSVTGTGLQIALIATVLNEYGSLPGWVGGLVTQSRYPDHCVIVDGGSTDGTLEYLQSFKFPFPCTIISAPGVNISRGRNIGIAAASMDVVVVTDAGTRAGPDWIARIVDPLLSNAELDVVAGFFAPDGGSFWSRTLAATTLPDSSDVDAASFLPSSRSIAFRGRWFEAGFCYPEWLDYCEDIVFDLQFRQAGAVQSFVPDAVVYFEPRGGPIAFARQYFRYARGDGKAGLFFRRHIIRYATYVLAALVVKRRHPVQIGVSIVAGMLYLMTPIRRFRRRSARPPSIRRWCAVVLMIGCQRFIGDVAKMAGYPVGLIWRVKVDRTIKFWRSGWRYRRPDRALPGA